MRYDSLIGGLVSGMGLIVISLWFWRKASDFADIAGATHLGLAICSIRLASIAGIAVAELLLLVFVVARFYRYALFDDVARGAAGIVFAVSLAAAIALALIAK